MLTTIELTKLESLCLMDRRKQQKQTVNVNTYKFKYIYFSFATCGPNVISGYVTFRIALSKKEIY